MNLNNLQKLSLLSTDSLYKRTFEQLVSGYYLKEQILDELRAYWVGLANRLDLFKMFEARNSYHSLPILEMPNFYALYHGDYLDNIKAKLIQYGKLEIKLYDLNNNIIVIKDKILFLQKSLGNALNDAYDEPNANIKMPAVQHRDKINQHINEHIGRIAKEHVLKHDILNMSQPPELEIDDMLKLLNNSLLESEMLKGIYTAQADHQAFTDHFFVKTLKPMPHHQIMHELFNNHCHHGFCCAKRDFVGMQMDKLAGELNSSCCNNDSYKSPAFYNQINLSVTN